MALGPRWVSPDARLVVVVARALRTFGYGCTSVLLGQMLVEDGDPPARIGILLAVAATGSVVASILMGLLYADRYGRRSSLLLSAGLMGMAGVVFEVFGVLSAASRRGLRRHGVAVDQRGGAPGRGLGWIRPASGNRYHRLDRRGFGSRRPGGRTWKVLQCGLPTSVW